MPAPATPPSHAARETPPARSSPARAAATAAPRARREVERRRPVRRPFLSIGDRLVAREVVVREPEEQLIAVRVPDHERRPSPVDALAPDPRRGDVLAKRRALIVLEADEEPSVTGAGARPLV